MWVPEYDRKEEWVDQENLCSAAAVILKHNKLKLNIGEAVFGDFQPQLGLIYNFKT